MGRDINREDNDYEDVVEIVNTPKIEHRSLKVGNIFIAIDSEYREIGGGVNLIFLEYLNSGRVLSYGVRDEDLIVVENN